MWKLIAVLVFALGCGDAVTSPTASPPDDCEPVACETGVVVAFGVTFADGRSTVYHDTIPAMCEPGTGMCVCLAGTDQ